MTVPDDLTMHRGLEEQARTHKKKKKKKKKLITPSQTNPNGL